MRKEGYYSTGQFAKLAQVTVRTIRFYDKKNILKPSYLTESGARFYTDDDLVKLQQILLFKYLGFSLEEISSMLVNDVDLAHLQTTLELQKHLMEDKMEQMQLVEGAIDQMLEKLRATKQRRRLVKNADGTRESRKLSAIENLAADDWSGMLNLIHLTSMEQSLKSQYENAGNIAARIRLHRDFSVNKKGWFPWVYDQIFAVLTPKKKSGTAGSWDDALQQRIRGLEVGCGNGALWFENMRKLPENLKVTLSDISEGMIREVRRNMDKEERRFSFATIDCQHIPYKDESFDFAVADHVLFYCEDVEGAIAELYRVLKPGGYLFCSAYGARHMAEITELVQEFDSRILLSGEKLYEHFGRENGESLLKEHFTDISYKAYPDEIVVDEAEPLVEYILSCHGNQNQHLLDRYRDFKSFTEKKVAKGFHVTKDVGLFICKK